MCDGDEVSLSVVASGTPPLTYQWRKDGADIAGATGSTFTIASFALGDEGNYEVVVTDFCSSTTSTAASLTRGLAPTITAQPIGQVVNEGDPATFSVTATSNIPLSYQWRLNGVAIAGATSDSLTVDPVTAADAGDYTVVVTTDCGSVTSVAATLTVALCPVVVAPPVAEVVCAGDPASFSVIATGATPLSYQWRKDSVAIPGATASTYAIVSTVAGDAGLYDVIVTNGCGSTTSVAVALDVTGIPTVTADPLTQNLCSGDAFVVFVAVDSPLPATYQWRRNGLPIVGATSSVFTIDPVFAGNAGDYDVEITNDCGSVVSATATLTIGEIPTIDISPVDEVICEGDPASFTVTATGTGTISYQWRRNGLMMIGADQPILTIATVTTADLGTYDVVVSNECGSATASAAELMLDDPPVIITEPVAEIACVDDSVVFDVDATGTALTYQWRKDGVMIPGATGSSFAILDVTTGDAGDYDVLVTNDCGSVTSVAAPLTLQLVPAVIAAPLDIADCDGGSVTLDVVATGTGPFTYQWRLDGVNVAGATADTLTIDPLTATEVGAYDVIISGPCGSVTSTDAIVSIATAPVIVTQPAGALVCEADDLTLTATATSPLPVTYQWRKDGVDIAGATSQQLLLENTELADSGSYSVVIDNGCGIATSNNAIVIILGPPTIFSSPGSVNECITGEVTLQVIAGADLPVTYQWRKDGIDIPGANGALFTLSNVTTADTADYDVVVSTFCSSSISAAATVTIDTPPTINVDPVTTIACEDDLLTFTVEAIGNEPLNYQWRKNGADIVGETGASFTIPSLVDGDSGDYDVVITNVCGTATSAMANLTVELLPFVVTAPATQVVCENDPVVLEVVAGGTGPFTYQWRKDGVDLAGETASTLNIASAADADTGTYEVVITTDCLTITSSSADLTVQLLPFVITPPADSNDCETGTVQLIVDAGGTGPLTYQWRKDGVDIAGATANTLLLEPLLPADDGLYDVVISNACTTITSAAAVVTVDLVPAISQQPLGQAACDGDSVTYEVIATGAAPLSYQWRRNFQDIVGATESTFTIDAITDADAGGLYDVIITNVCGEVTSTVATLNVNAPPSFFTAPADVAACEMSSTTLSAIMLGTPPLTFQWFKDGVEIDGATTSNLNLSNLDVDDVASYTVEVTNSCGTVVSDPALVTLEELPDFVTQPLTQSVCEGGMVTLSVEVTSVDVPTYQWRRNGINLPGANFADLTIASATAADGGVYTCRVTNNCGLVTSDVATLTVDLNPTIVTEPVDQVDCVGGMVTLSVVAAGAEPLTYQWRKDGVNVAGATSDTLTLSALLLTDGGAYDCVVTNGCSSITSAAADVFVNDAAVFSLQPTDLAACEGAMATFSVEVIAVPPISYQWKRNGLDVAGATEATLVIDTVGATVLGGYSVEVTDACGTITSDIAQLTLADPPAIDTDPVGGTVCQGDPFTLSVTATGEPPLTYEWRLDGVAIAGATDPTYMIGSTGGADDGVYTCAVSNACGIVVSAAADLTVDLLPMIIVQPFDQGICEGDTANFVVIAVGAEPITYQWQKDGVALPGQTGSSLNFEGVTTLDEGEYSVIVSNNCSTVTSAVAELTILLPPTLIGPFDNTVCVGDAATFTVLAAGSAPFSYQWRKEGVLLPGETTDTLSFTSVVLSDAGLYTVDVTNDCETVTSVEVALNVGDVPVIVEQPIDRVGGLGESITLSVTAAGVDLTYQWRMGGVDIPGATEADYTIASLVAGDSGLYDVVISNLCGSVTSTEMELSVASLATDLTSTCCNVEGTSQIDWVTTDVFDNVEIYRDGILVAFLGGAVTSHTEVLVTPGDYLYEVVGVIGIDRTIPVPCTVTLVDPVFDFSCDVTSIAGGVQDTTLAWINADLYDSINVYRDDVLIATLGGSEESLVDSGVTVAAYDYRVEAIVASSGCDSVGSTTCTSVDDPPLFIRGDSNGDQLVNIADIVNTLNYLVGDGSVPPCLDAADANDDGFVDISDGIYLIRYQFQAGAEPPTPFPTEGPDPTTDNLDCATSPFAP